MINEYKSFTLKEILDIIHRCAIGSLLVPTGPYNGEKTVDQVLQANNAIAWCNEGVRTLADRLVAELTEDGSDEKNI